MSYYTTHKEKMKQKSLERYYKHRSRLAEKVTCACGNKVSRQNLNQHRRSRMHTRRLLGKFIQSHLVLISKT